MKYAVIKTGSKQYKVQEGETIKVELLSIDKDVVFEEVLLFADGEKVTVGTPFVKDIKVYGTVVSQKKGEKVQVFKYKSKSRYRKLRGHRQSYSEVKITSIGAAPTVSRALPTGRSGKASAKAATVSPTKPARRSAKALVKKTAAK